MKPNISLTFVISTIAAIILGFLGFGLLARLSEKTADVGTFLVVLAIILGIVVVAVLLYRALR